MTKEGRTPDEAGVVGQPLRLPRSAGEAPTLQKKKERSESAHRDSDFVINPSSIIRHSALTGDVIASAAQLSKLIEQITPVSRVAIDTEADSLHSYREKLCLLQLSVSGRDCIVD